MSKRFVLKIGSQVLVDRNGFVQRTILSEILDQVIELRRQKHSVMIVSSGACALGRALLKKASTFLNKSLETRVAATLGQPTLLNCYQQKAYEHGLFCSQILLTKDDFRTRERYLRLMYLFEGLLSEENIIPIVNENDAVTDQESMFTDNDELAGLLASQIRADKLIIMSTIDGVYNKHPDEPGAYVLKTIMPEDLLPSMDSRKSSLGRGGMQSKLGTALKVSKLGIETVVMNADKRHLLSKIEDTPDIGTRILASKTVSSLKRWLSFSKGIAGVYINDCAEKVLHESTVSLLPVGISAIEGQFNKNDVIYVLNQNHQIVAIGLSAYSSEELKQYMGASNNPELIHYNHLYVY